MISVSTENFARIWSLRRDGEESEDEILHRILKEVKTSGPKLNELIQVSRTEIAVAGCEVEKMGKVRWVDDVIAALRILGGEAPLHDIYSEVRIIRNTAGRSAPKTLEAVVRRTIEDHSSDSDNFRGEDRFMKVERGVWALRSK